MDDITRSEFWILWSHRNGAPFEAPMDSIHFLLEQDLLTLTDVPVSDADKLGIRFKVFVNREGIRACEHFRDDYFDRRWTSIRSWIAIAISVASLIIMAIRSL